MWDLRSEPRRRPSGLQITGHLALSELCLLPFPGRAEASCQATRGLPRCPLGVEPCRVMKHSGPGTESIFSFSNIGESTEAVQPGGQEIPSWLSHSTASGRCQLSGVTQSRSLHGPRCPVRESVIFTSSWTIPAPRDISELHGRGP